jgi:hypothetical protein
LQWEPEKTWVFAVGVLTYPSGQHWPDKGRRDAEMIGALEARGVPKDQITFIKNQSATLAHVRRSFDTLLARAPADAVLWLYFAGHGDKRDDGVCEFRLYDGQWPIPDVISAIERRFAGSTALLFADCCYSGSLGMEAMQRAGRVSYGALTSSLASTMSTGAWTFTECLIAGLRGTLPHKPDGESSITFAELARFAEREMAFNDGQLSTCVTANGFDPSLVLAPGMQPEHPRLGEHVEARWKDGHWYPGRIEKAARGKFWIRWAGYKENANNWIEERNVRPYVPEQQVPGTRLDVQWNGKWYPAEVLTGRWGMHLVRYDDFASTWDEWVSPKRMRPARRAVAAQSKR